MGHRFRLGLGEYRIEPDAVTGVARRLAPVVRAIRVRVRVRVRVRDIGLGLAG